MTFLCLETVLASHLVTSAFGSRGQKRLEEPTHFLVGFGRMMTHWTLVTCPPLTWSKLKSVGEHLGKPVAASGCVHSSVVLEYLPSTLTAPDKYLCSN